jgi:hypothetical protein
MVVTLAYGPFPWLVIHKKEGRKIEDGATGRIVQGSTG